MSRLYNDIMQALEEAIEIKKGNVQIKEKIGMPAPTFVVEDVEGKVYFSKIEFREYIGYVLNSI